MGLINRRIVAGSCTLSCAARLAAPSAGGRTPFSTGIQPLKTWMRQQQPCPQVAGVC